MTLREQITALPKPDGRPLIIAISGFGGSGKTTLANELKDQLKDAELVCIDSFSKHEWQRDAEWSNFDRDRFTKEILQPARTNKFPLVYAHEPWPGQAPEPAVQVTRCSYLIVEGCSILHPDLLKYYDFKIWVDCPLELATERGMWRDRHVHKNEHDHHWKNIWEPNEKDFYDKYRPDQSADVLVDTTTK